VERLAEDAGVGKILIRRRGAARWRPAAAQARLQAPRSLPHRPVKEDLMIRSLLATTALALALMPWAAGAQQAESGYVDISAYPLSDAQYDDWLQLQASLRRDFDEICGDTFCEGDYSNIESLRFLCSVDSVSGRLGMCAWMFAASNEEIDPLTGRIRVSQRGFWRCRAPIVSGTTIEQLLETLDVEEPLYEPLPMTAKSMMDGLIDCL
jgi:hypothetical protein